ncbi:MAG TPA: DUF4347 domain-containing protein [Telluria sp.]|nr:DUF4347 domain-containing protein [Telluria sp.]
MSKRFSQLAFIVDDVDGAADLAAQLPPHVCPVLVDHHFDGLAQIASTLRTCGGLDAIHLFCNVDGDELSLGTVQLAEPDVARYVGDLSELARALGGRGHLLVYPGSDEEQGAAVVEALRRVLGPGVAAVYPNMACGSHCGGWCLGRYAGALSAA